MAGNGSFLQEEERVDLAIADLTKYFLKKQLAATEEVAMYKAMAVILKRLGVHLEDGTPVDKVLNGFTGTIDL